MMMFEKGGGVPEGGGVSKEEDYYFRVLCFSCCYFLQCTGLLRGLLLLVYCREGFARRTIAFVWLSCETYVLSLVCFDFVYM